MRERFAIKSVWAAYVVLTLDALILGSTGVVGKLVLVDMPIMAFIFWRWVAAFLLLAPFAAREFIASWPIIRAHWKLMLALALLGSVQFNSLWYIALQSTSAINATLLSGAQPAAIVLAVWFMTRQTSSLRAVLGMVLAFIGLVAIVVRGEFGVLLTLEFVIGDLMILLAVAVWSVYTVLLRRFPKDLGLPSFLLFVYGMAIIVVTPLYAWEVSQGITFTPILDAVLLILYLIIFVSMLHNVFWIRGVGVVGPSTAGQFNYLIAVFGSGLAILVLGEEFQLFHLVGMVLILAGVYLAAGKRRDRSREAPSEQAGEPATVPESNPPGPPGGPAGR